MKLPGHPARKVRLPRLRPSLSRVLLVSLGLLFPALLTAVAAGRPLKVFILAGQSNMQGHARISTFDSLADDPRTAPLLGRMRTPDGKPRVCERVWISSVGCLGDAYSDLNESKGRLTAGFGAPTDKIGPEFTFGLAMESRLQEPILIIKTAWGGRSLNTEFRPPSAGPYELNEFQRKLYYGPPAHGVPKDMNQWLAEKKKETGLSRGAQLNKWKGGRNE